ncbi:MAG: 5,10-methylenetetrahydromethanopterin reductase [Candidatus Bathyarchaeia archaeon]
MRFGLNTAPMWPPNLTGEVYRIAEEKGVDYAWLTDYVNSRDVFSVLMAIALRTRKIKLGPGITNPYTRHPVTIAASAISLDEASQGRAFLGIGAGDGSLLKTIGIQREQAYERVKETIEILKKIFSGEVLNYEGEFFKFLNFKFLYPPFRPIPVHIGARGPKMLRLASEMADGVYIDALNPTETKLSLEELKEGIAKANRKLTDMELASGIIFYVSNNIEEAKNSVKWLVALVASSASDRVLTRLKIDLESVKILKASIEKKGLESSLSLVTDDMIETFAVAGPSRLLIEAIEKLEKIGLNQTVLINVEFDVKKLKEQLIKIGEEVIPVFKEV